MILSFTEIVNQFSPRLCSFVAVASLVITLGLPGFAQSHRPQGEKLYTFKAESDLVLVNVVVRDRKGNAVSGLKAEDFTVLEDGKAQRVASFDVEEATVSPAGPAQAEMTEAPLTANILTSNETPADLRDRRLIVIFFDLSSMQPDDSQRGIDAALAFVNQQMTSVDLVAIVSYSGSLQVIHDFTSDRGALAQALIAMSSTEGEGLAQGTTGDSSGQPDTGAEFTADDTEYNLFNTDLSLQAISSVAEALGRLQQRKSILYFSAGLTKTGVDNQAALRAAINTAVRSNVALYSLDIRGLQALPPGGNATVGSLRGTSAYTGAAVQSDLDKNSASQETLVTIARDTGGKAYLDSNDFGRVFTGILQDTAAY